MPAQLSLFSVGVRPPAYADLEGLLAGPAHVVRRAGTARVSVLLPSPEPWRVAVLLESFAELDLGAEVATAEFGLSVRTRFAKELEPLAARWTSGAVTTAPPGLALDGARLRWWCLAAGHRDAVGYALRLSDVEASWAPVGAALAAAGVPGTLVRPRPDGQAGSRPGSPATQAYRIVGARRLTRLAELVGPAPEGASDWPTA